MKDKFNEFNMKMTRFGDNPKPITDRFLSFYCLIFIPILSLFLLCADGYEWHLSSKIMYICGLIVTIRAGMQP